MFGNLITTSERYPKRASSRVGSNPFGVGSALARGGGWRAGGGDARASGRGAHARGGGQGLRARIAREGRARKSRAREREERARGGKVQAIFRLFFVCLIQAIH